MSASILLKQTMSRRTDVALHLAQHCLIIVGLVFALGFITPVSGEPMAEAFQALWPEISASADLAEAEEGRAERGASADSDGNALSPRMRGALTYVAQRYKVSVDAVRPVLEAVQVIGQEQRIDPLLIVAVIATFLVDPFAVGLCLAVFAAFMLYFAVYSRHRLVANSPDEEFAMLAEAEDELK